MCGLFDVLRTEHGFISGEENLFYNIYRVDHLVAEYRVGLVVWQLGWVDLDLECSTILLGQ